MRYTQNMIWELWEHHESNEDCVCLSYFPAYSRAQRQLPGHARKIWSTEALSLVDAMNKRNEYLGWAAYQPMLDEAGRPYPADLEPYLK